MNGTYDPLTKRAVKAFQLRDQLSPEGMVGSIAQCVFSGTASTSMPWASHVRERLANLSEMKAAKALEWLVDRPGSISQISHAEACAHEEFMARELGRVTASSGARTGFRWTSASGYIDLWSRLYRAEEVLILFMPITSVVSQAHYDLWRLRRSNMGNASELLNKLASAGMA